MANLLKVQTEDYDTHVYTTTRYRDRVGVSEFEGALVHRFYSPIQLWNINPVPIMLRSIVASHSDILHVHSHLYTTSNQAAVARRMGRAKMLLQLHGGVGPPPFRTALTRLLAKRLYDRTLGAYTLRSGDVIASVSQSDLDYLASQLSFPVGRLRYVPNVVDTEIFRPVSKTRSSSENVLLYVGDFEPWKGVGLLVDWIRRWNRHDGHNITVRFVGQGSFFNELLKLQEELKNNGEGVRVEVLGRRMHHEIPSIMHTATALVMPSYWEGMPTVVLEAMASGIPVISTAVGHVSAVLRDRETGFVIDHTLASFERAVSDVLENDHVVHSITQNARALVQEEFSLAVAKRRLDSIYREIPVRTF